MNPAGIALLAKVHCGQPVSCSVLVGPGREQNNFCERNQKQQTHQTFLTSVEKQTTVVPAESQPTSFVRIVRGSLKIKLTRIAQETLYHQTGVSRC